MSKKQPHQHARMDPKEWRLIASALRFLESNRSSLVKEGISEQWIDSKITDLKMLLSKNSTAQRGASSDEAR